MKRRGSARLDWRVSLTVAVGVTAATLMILLSMEPRLALVAVVVTIISAVTWLAVDLGPVAAPIVWIDHGERTDTAPRSDRRVRALRTRLRSPAHRSRVPTLIDTARSEPDDEIADTLVAIIDDHIEAEFGIDRSHDPEAADDVLGPELARFVSDPSAHRSMTGRRGLARTVALIEDLCARTHAP
ncbi:MAG: hypothetical protein AB8G26_12350 [Ilumatobacter sp.]